MIQHTKENYLTRRTVDIDERWYEELEAEAIRENVTATELLERILLAYFYPPAKY